MDEQGVGGTKESESTIGFATCCICLLKGAAFEPLFYTTIFPLSWNEIILKNSKHRTLSKIKNTTARRSITLKLSFINSSLPILIANLAVSPSSHFFLRLIQIIRASYRFLGYTNLLLQLQIKSGVLRLPSN